MDLTSLASQALLWLSPLCLLLAGAGCLYGLAASFFVGRYGARRIPALPGEAGRR